MSVSLSFWQQDQNWRIRQQSWTQQLSGNSMLSSAMATAMSTRSRGMAAIANQQALTRVNNQIKAALNEALHPTANSSSSGASAAPLGPIGASKGVAFNSSAALSTSATASTLLSGVLAQNIRPPSSSGTAQANLITGGSFSSFA